MCALGIAVLFQFFSHFENLHFHRNQASYGFMADAHLYARYGFVNGDGSGPIQLSLAFHHEMMKLNISNQYDYIPDTLPFASLLPCDSQIPSEFDSKA